MNSVTLAALPDSPVGTASRGAILHELATVASQAVNAQLDGLITRLAEAMARMTGQDTQEARRCQNAASLLKKNRYPFCYVASARLTTLLQQEMLRAGYPLPEHVDTGDAPQSLPPELEIDKKLCLIKASQAIEANFAEPLATLNLRLAALLDYDSFTTAQNPFRPHIFLSALHEAWCEFQPDTDSHHLVFRLLGPELSPDMGPILRALNDTLVKRGVAPRQAQAMMAGATASAAAARPSCGGDAQDNDPLLRALRRLFPDESKETVRAVAGDFPTLFQDDAVHTSAARNELLAYLARMQNKLTALLPADIRRQAPELALSETDDGAIGLVAKVFEQIRNNAHLPDALKAMIVSLHLPVLKTALTDSAFFFKPAHPARRALELLVRVSLTWDPDKGQSDPAYPLVARCVRRIQDEGGRHIAAFVEAGAELDAFLRREDTATAQMLAASIAQATQQDKVLQANKVARHEVGLRVGTGEVVAFVETFLENKWVAVLTLAYTLDGQPQAADSALRTMDELVWSVKPKITAEERKELLARLPAMVAGLNKWLDLIRWNGEERARFFDELAKCHASIVRAPLELSPQRQVELAIAAAQKAAERRAQRRANGQVETPPDAFDATVMKLASGTWIAFRQNGRDTMLRLAWISPMRNLYVFSGRQRKEALTLTAEELARTLRTQGAQVVPAAGLVRRALEEALGVGANDEGDMRSAV